VNIECSGDAGRRPDELFTPAFEFLFPKFGVGRGLEEFHQCTIGLIEAGHKLVHHRDQLKYFVSDRHVIVEGTTEGSDCEGLVR
jgi:hypothetical protein